MGYTAGVYTSYARAVYTHKRVAGAHEAAILVDTTVRNGLTESVSSTCIIVPEKERLLLLGERPQHIPESGHVLILPAA